MRNIAPMRSEISISDDCGVQPPDTRTSSPEAASLNIDARTEPTGSAIICAKPLRLEQWNRRCNVGPRQSQSINSTRLPLRARSRANDAAMTDFPSDGTDELKSTVFGGSPLTDSCNPIWILRSASL